MNLLFLGIFIFIILILALSWFAKANVKKTNKQIAEETDLPITKVEHWFRTDSSFAIPSDDIWFKLKEVLDIKKAFDQTKNIKLKFGFNHRCHYSVIEAKRIMNSRQMGKLMWARGFYGKSGGINFEKEWRSSSNVAGGGILLDQGIHMVDLMRLFGGEYVQVHSFVSNSRWGYNVEDNVYALMRTSEGIVAILNSSATQWRHLFHLDIKCIT